MNHAIRCKSNNNLLKKTLASYSIGLNRIYHINLFLIINFKDVKKELARWNDQVPINSAPTPPNTWYTSKEFFEFEKEKVFKTNWLCVGDSEDTQQAQSFISGTYLGEPYLVCKDDNNEVNAMYNVCRHHGSTIKKVRKKLKNKLYFSN